MSSGSSLRLAGHRLNIPAIEASLAAVQREFPRINAHLSDRRDPLTDEVVANMVAGYRCVDRCLSEGIDLFGMGESARLVEVNRVVLCGESGRRQGDEHPGHLDHAQRQFYETEGGGVGGLMDWLALHRTDSACKLAAGVFARVLSQPQLYPEGNHRTGALLMSYLLARDGRPPFVLTVDNARHFFEPATLIKNRKKHGLDKLVRLPKLTKRFARMIEDDADGHFLLKR